MKAQPIIMQPESVLGLLEDRKGQTRRVILGPRHGLKVNRHPLEPSIIATRVEQRDDGWYFSGGMIEVGPVVCPYGKPGDLLWARESWARRLDEDHLRAADIPESDRWAWYWADGPGKTCHTGCAGAAGRVRSARFMPRWASRLTLRLTDVRVQRVQQISHEDAKAEGLRHEPIPPTTHPLWRWSDKSDWFSNPRECFHQLWDSINAARGYSWDANPWCWCLTFEVIKQNVDSYIYARATAA